MCVHLNARQAVPLAAQLPGTGVAPAATPASFGLRHEDSAVQRKSPGLSSRRPPQTQAHQR